jgi:pimeloyl-ACP methyl ester carboxylesterase
MAMCLVSGTASADVVHESTSSISTVEAKDGTAIAVECAGAGPNLVIVHGGTGDRTRWKPLFPLFVSHFTACAMDRRGHGASSDSPDYSLEKEVEDLTERYVLWRPHSSQIKSPS